MDAKLEAALHRDAERQGDAALLSLASVYEIGEAPWLEFDADAAEARWMRTAQVLDALREAARNGDADSALELAGYLAPQDSKAVRRIAKTAIGRHAFAERQVPIVSVWRMPDGTRRLATREYVKPKQAGSAKRANTRRAELNAAQWNAWVVSYMRRNNVDRGRAERVWLDEQMLMEYPNLRNPQSVQYKRARKALRERIGRARRKATSHA